MYDLHRNYSEDMKEEIMKKLKKSLCFTILFMALLLGSFSHSVVFAQDIETYSETRYLVNDHWIPMNAGITYLSETFSVDEPVRLYYAFGAEGTSGNQSHYYRFYIQEKNNNGTWSTLNYHNIVSGEILNTSFDASPDKVYRIKAVTNDSYARSLFVQVFYYIR